MVLLDFAEVFNKVDFVPPKHLPRLIYGVQ